MCLLFLSFLTENGDTWFLERRKRRKKKITQLTFWTESKYEKLSQTDSGLICFNNEKKQEKLSGQIIVLLVTIIWLAASPVMYFSLAKRKSLLLSWSSPFKERDPAFKYN